MDAPVFGFSLVLRHTMAWEHPGAAGGPLPCPADARDGPEKI